MTYLCEEDGEPLKQSKLNVAIIFQHMVSSLMVNDWSDVTSVRPTHRFEACLRARTLTGSLKRSSRVRDGRFIVLGVETEQVDKSIEGDCSRCFSADEMHADRN